jgi:hypothetical protein
MKQPGAVVTVAEYGSAYRLDEKGYLLYAGINTDGTVDESGWSHVELSAIEDELDVEKLKRTLELELGTFKIMA